MFLQIHFNQLVVNSVDWTGSGKAHTCLNNLTQRTVLVKETGFSPGTNLGKGTKLKMSAGPNVERGLDPL